MINIPDIPQNGGDLVKYFDMIEDEIGWIPEGTTARGKELEAALRSDNDPATWIAFAGHTLQTVWEAMPADIRSKLQLALRDIVDLGLQRVQSVVTDAASAAVGNVAEAIPLIGTIIKAVLVVIDASVEYAKQIDDQNKMFSRQDYYSKRFETISNYSHPDSLVYQQMHVLNYFSYKKKGNVWRKRPSYARSSGAADRIFLGSSGLSDVGSCGKGLLMDCPSGSFFDWDDCSYHNSDDKACYRRLGISSLFFPFWSPACSDLGLIKFRYDYESLNPNTLLAANQMLLLSNPNINLMVNGERLRNIRDRFRKFFLDQVNVYNGLLKISNGKAPGTPKGDRITIDDSKRSDYVPTSKDKNKLYFDSDGLIKAYSGTANLSKWGVRATRGPQTPRFAAISIAQYNAVIGSSLAFFSARANFLRNGPLMKALESDYGISNYDKEVRNAMKYSADYGKNIPPPSLSFTVRAIKVKPKRMTKDDVGDESSIIPLVLGAGAITAAAYFMRMKSGDKK